MDGWIGEYVCTYVRTYVCMYVCNMCVCMYVCMCIYIYIYIYLFMHVCVFMCVYRPMHVYVRGRVNKLGEFTFFTDMCMYSRTQYCISAGLNT
jgi:hypothetical protein